MEEHTKLHLSNDKKWSARKELVENYKNIHRPTKPIFHTVPVIFHAVFSKNISILLSAEVFSNVQILQELCFDVFKYIDIGK